MRSQPHHENASSSSAYNGCVEYTQDEYDTVERIRHCKDYYEMFNLQNDSNTFDTNLKEEYRKLALKVHPDKCRVPHASEAFIALDIAYKVLSDKEKRQEYDEETLQVIRRRDAAQREAAELINAYYRSAFHPRSSASTHQTREASSIWSILPLMYSFAFFIIMPSFITAIVYLCMDANSPEFSLFQTGKYAYRRITKDMRVVYYVRSNFLKKNRGRVQQIGKQVEYEYVEHLRTNCLQEQKNQAAMKYRLKTMPNCDQLQELNLDY